MDGRLERPLSEEIVIKGNSVKQIIHTLLNVTVDEGIIEIFELENHSEEVHLIKTIRVFEELRLIP